jgi:hypothetical protein
VSDSGIHPSLILASFWGYHFDIYDSEWGKVVFLKNKTNPTDTTKDGVGYEQVNGEWYKFYKRDDGFLYRVHFISPLL